MKPFSRSIPETLPQVKTTSPFLGNIMFASYTFCFNSSNIVIPQSCTVQSHLFRDLIRRSFAHPHP